MGNEGPNFRCGLRTNFNSNKSLATVATTTTWCSIRKIHFPACQVNWEQFSIYPEDQQNLSRF